MVRGSRTRSGGGLARTPTRGGFLQTFVAILVGKVVVDEVHRSMPDLVSPRTASNDVVMPPVVWNCSSRGTAEPRGDVRAEHGRIMNRIPFLNCTYCASYPASKATKLHSFSHAFARLRTP